MYISTHTNIHTHAHHLLIYNALDWDFQFQPRIIVFPLIHCYVVDIFCFIVYSWGDWCLGEIRCNWNICDERQHDPTPKYTFFFFYGIFFFFYWETYDIKPIFGGKTKSTVEKKLTLPGPYQNPENIFFSLKNSRCFIIDLLIQNDLLNLQFVVLGVEIYRTRWEVFKPWANFCESLFGLWIGLSLSER